MTISAALAPPPRISAIEAASAAMGLLFRNPQLLLIALAGSVLSNVPQLLFEPLGAAIATTDDPGTQQSITMNTAIGLAVVGFFAAWLSLIPGMMLNRAGFECELGDEIGTLDALQETIHRFFPLVGLFLLMMLGTLVGAVLLLVPALILISMWLVAAPACILEDLGPIESLRRSFDLTRGNRFRLLLVMLVGTILIMLVIVVPVTVVSLLMGEAMGFIVGILVGTVNFGFYVLFPLVAYMRLAGARLNQA